MYNYIIYSGNKINIAITVFTATILLSLVFDMVFRTFHSFTTYWFIYLYHTSSVHASFSATFCFIFKTESPQSHSATVYIKCRVC